MRQIILNTMNAEKMTADKKPTIGNIIEGHANRDAIHVAVVPAIAADKLQPGERVGFDKDGKAVSYKNRTLGIVDPFLDAPVEPGQKFWIFMYPNTVVNLRHEWDHPLIVTSAAVNPDSGRSIEWLTDYAKKHSKTYDDLISGAREFVAKGCDDAVMDDDFNDYEVPEEFWIHFEAVTGLKGNGNFWGCCI